MNKSIVLDTNIIQCLFMILKTPDGPAKLQATLNPEEFSTLFNLSMNYSTFNCYITTQIYEELKACEKFRYKGILKFATSFCKIKPPKKYKESAEPYLHILDLQKLYLKKDIPLRDRTVSLQQAISSETKNGVEDFSDSLIVSEKNITTGYPMFTLNEQHLICMNEARKKSVPYRSRAILLKNLEYLHNKNIDDKTIKANLQKEDATTFRIKNIFDDEYTPYK